MQTINGKYAVITGAGRGIGRSTTIALAREGVNVALLGKTIENLQSVQKEIDSYGVQSLAIQMDVKDASTVQSAIQEVLQTFGTVDILINNAGIGAYGKFMELTEDDWDKVYEVNVKGVLRVTQAVLPHMIERRTGDIINISSTSGLRGTEGSSAYSATKFALHGLTESLMKEMRKHKIRVQSLSPSRVITDFGGGKNRLTDEEAEHFMQAEDVADVIVSKLKLHPRMFVKHSELWATDPQ
ncbi:3-ketoacyl-ACP reductase [Bacillaceae bacterium JMAK1]|nr:3-ketoacyl-ACP reductase [Bacillaceae bacterium JMAK1]